MNYINSEFRRIGFTLAEVLITLTIIGVVAAIVIPNINNSIQDIQYKAAYKKAYSAAYQSILLAGSKNLLVPAITADVTTHISNFQTFMDQFVVSRQCINNDNNLCWDTSGENYGEVWGAGSTAPRIQSPAFTDSSGRAWTMAFNNDGYIFVDTNGSKKPNQWGKDRFAFWFVDINGSGTSGLPIKIIPFPDSSGGSNMCYKNACATENYYGTSWLCNEN